MLYLLYFPEPANKKVEIDHIFPKSKLEIETLIKEYDLSHSQAKKINEQTDRIGNLQILRRETNRSKGDVLFEDWKESRITKYGKFMPNEDYKIENFPKFVHQREEKMISYIVKTYSNI